MADDASQYADNTMLFPKRIHCQVLGCDSDLTKESRSYCYTKRICSAHLQAECLTLPGHGEHVFRFCFQCGKLEPLSAFDGNKRSCRMKLSQRRAARQAIKAANVPSSYGSPAVASTLAGAPGSPGHHQSSYDDYDEPAMVAYAPPAPRRYSPPQPTAAAVPYGSVAYGLPAVVYAACHGGGGAGGGGSNSGAGWQRQGSYDHHQHHHQQQQPLRHTPADSSGVPHHPWRAAGGLQPYTQYEEAAPAAAHLGECATHAAAGGLAAGEEEEAALAAAAAQHDLVCFDALLAQLLEGEDLFTLQADSVGGHGTNSANSCSDTLPASCWRGSRSSSGGGGGNGNGSARYLPPSSCCALPPPSAASTAAGSSAAAECGAPPLLQLPSPRLVGQQQLLLSPSLFDALAAAVDPGRLPPHCWQPGQTAVGAAAPEGANMAPARPWEQQP